MTLSPAGRRLALVLAIAGAVRVGAVLLSARTTVDVLRYHKVAEHVLDVSWNPYLAPRLYPYPPLWVWFEAAAGWLERQGLPFAIVVKLPIVAADIGIVALLATWSMRAAWMYALHPVSILVTGFHGQFDALMLLFVLAAVRWHEQGAHDRSALALAAAVATKSVPILLLPFFWLALPSDTARRLRFAALAVGPVLLSLVPYALHDVGALRRELVGYGGIADFGWIGVLRGWRYLAAGELLKSRPDVWGALVPAAKVLFLAAYALLVWTQARRRLTLPLPAAVCAVFLAFLVFYGLISAQYLLWPVAVGAILGGGWFAGYGVAAAFGLAGFYAFLAPGVFYDDEMARGEGTVWVAGATAVLVASAGWLAALVRPHVRR
jgi:hypothetical protein